MSVADTFTSRLASLSTRSMRYIEPVTRAAAPVARASRTAAGAVPMPGRIVIGGAIGCLIAGFLLHWSELVFIGATLAAALAIASVYAIGRTTYAVTVELNPRRVVVGGRALGRIGVTNSGTRPVFGSRIELPVGVANAEFQVPRLAPGQEHEDLFAVPTQRRALILAGPATSVRGDQLGLLRRTQNWTDRIELFVHPVTTRLKASAQGLVRDLEGQPTKTITNSDLAFHALRPYEQGDSMRNVHWRTSARTGQLMVRQYQETRRSQMLLVLGADAAHYASGDEFELAVSVLASVGLHVIGEESQITAGWDGGVLHTGSPVSLLDDSCRVDPVRRGAKPLREVVRALAARRAQPSVVLLVVGSQTPAAELRAVATLFNHDTVFTAVRADLGGEAVMRRSGPVTVASIAALRELPLMLSRLGTRQ
ncbi:DUF58 domain-containing protein [Gryllotalpicola protaetiae]|uniref:DUF58 domain-containing protein n=1 Tax=Gryllotalpicola protaetiae TaxID=2419771 RepID=A0A387BPX4_9MICO|nr:DUF58 domain-containing protein [Gryllotalpicola protaetiae]AYG03067.1 DUF58 domain-containing protein [Gryllotalpicola protaetiae]